MIRKFLKAYLFLFVLAVFFTACSNNDDEDSDTPKPAPVASYYVTIRNASNGSVKASSAKASKDSTVNLSVTPNDGYELESLTVKDEKDNPVEVKNNSFKMPASEVVVSAVFKETIVQHSITITQSANGTVTTEKKSGITKGTSIVLTVSPSTGYELDSISVKDSAQQTVTVDTKTNSFIMPDSDVTVSASFKEAAKTYSVTIAPTTNGKIEADKTTGITKGTSVTLTFTPDEGYILTDLQVNVDDIEIEDAAYDPITNSLGCTFAMPGSDLSIIGKFEKIVDRITINSEIPSYFNKKRDSGYAVSMDLSIDEFNDSTKFSKNLALASLFMAVKTSTTEKITDFFEKHGFSNIEASFDTTGNPNAISYCIAHRTINYTDLIAVSIAGFNYGNQFGGNFNVGRSGDHAGFTIAANAVYDGLKKYIEGKYADSYEAKSICLWITGYSRSGAVANVLSHILQGVEGKKLDIPQDQIFTYTFEAPVCLSVDNAPAYPNVFNILESVDLVPYVPPKEYGLKRCGIDKYIFDPKESDYIKHIETDTTEYPSADYVRVTEKISFTTKVDEYLTTLDSEIVLPHFGSYTRSYYKYPGKEPDIPEDPKRDYKTEKEMIEYFIGLIMKKSAEDTTGGYSFKTREDYFNKLQPQVSYAFEVLFPYQGIIADEFSAKIKDSPLSALQWFMSDGPLYNEVKGILDKHNIPYDATKLQAACSTVFQLIDLPNTKGCLTEVAMKLVTLFMGKNTSDFTRVINMHYPETVYVLLKNYSE